MVNAPESEVECLFDTCSARLVWNEGFMEYDFGPHHPLRPERFSYGLDLLRESGLWRGPHEALDARPASGDELRLIHTTEYVGTVERLDAGEMLDPYFVAGHGLGSGDNPAFPGIHEASSLIAGGTLQAARDVMAGQYQHAFNPAGGLHHAMPDRASGFCVYNDPALAIAALLREQEARVLYLDFDAHHGDGVQAIFYREPRVLTFSIHETGRYLFPGTGEVDEVGEEAGRGYSLNAPMEPFTQDDTWLAAVNEIVPELAEAFRPDVIVSQHGCDGHAWDPLTHLCLTTRCFDTEARLVHELAHAYCGGRWIATGGGGYDFRRVVPRTYAAVIARMTGRELPCELPETWRERWAPTAPDPLPTEYLDSPDDFPPTQRADEIRLKNAETVRRIREEVLPLLRRSRG